VTSASFSLETQAFTPLWSAWFECSNTAYSCAQDECVADSVLATQAQPSAAVMGLQLASMSMITTLFGVFFGAQSLTRLRKEYMDGSMRRKFGQLFRSRSSKPSATVEGHAHHATISTLRSVVIAAYHDAESSHQAGDQRASKSSDFVG